MELMNYEERTRSFKGCAVFLFALFLAGGFSLATIVIFWQREWLGLVIFGSVAAFLLFLCGSFIYGFVKNDVWRFGIRDNVIWWDSPRWPRLRGLFHWIMCTR